MRCWLLLALLASGVATGCAPQSAIGPVVDTPSAESRTPDAPAGDAERPADGAPSATGRGGAASSPPPTDQTSSRRGVSRRGRAAQAVRPAEPSGPPPPPPERYPLSLRSACFANQLREEPWLPEAAASTVLVVAANGTGARAMSTGWVVRDSGVEGGLANAILTSLHGVQESMKDGILAIVSSFGRPIGWAEVEVKANPRGGQTDGLGAVIPTGDIALLRIRGFAPGGAEVYRSIRGIEIAREQHPRILRGVFSDPAGIEYGASGSPVLDGEGRAIGVMVRRWDRNEGGMWRAKVEVPGGNPLDQRTVGVPPTTTTVKLPDRATAYVEPIFDPDILARLGPPGQGLALRRSGERAPVRVVVPGFPQSTCVIFRGEVSPL